MYQSNRSLNIPPPRATPQAFEFLENFGSNSPEAEKLFKCPIIGPFQVIKCPHPRETFQWLLLCSESCVCKHGLIENNLTCHEARGGQVTGNHPPKRTNNKVKPLLFSQSATNRISLALKSSTDSSMIYQTISRHAESARLET